MWTKLFTTACIALVVTGASVIPNKLERHTVKQKRQSAWNYRPQNYPYEQYDYLPETAYYPKQQAEYYPKSEPTYYPKSESVAYYSKSEPTYYSTTEPSTKPKSESVYYQRPQPETAYYPKPQSTYYPQQPEPVYYPSKYETNHYPKYDTYRPYEHYKPSSYYDNGQKKKKPCKHEYLIHTSTTHAPSTTTYATHAFPSVLPVKKPLKHGLIDGLLQHTEPSSTTTERYHFVH